MSNRIANHRPSLLRAIALVATTAIGLAAGAGTASAGVCSVYVDGDENVAAGHDFFSHPFFVGGYHVGLGYSVMPNLTTGQDNVGIGFIALNSNTTGNNNVATG